MLYYVDLEQLRSVRLTSMITKTPETRIFPVESGLFEIHFCTLSEKLSLYDIYLHFPGRKSEFNPDSAPMVTFAICIKTDENFCKEFDFDSNFRLLRKGNFVLPDSNRIPKENLTDMNVLFSSVRSHDMESIKMILQKINYFSWKSLGLGSYSYAYVLNALRFIEKHHKEKMTIQTIADRCLLTPNYLSRIFLETTGRTVKNVIDIVRASNAREDLYFSEKSLPKLAKENGFSTRTSMTKIFQFLFEMTPEECRDADRNERSSPLPYEHCMMNLLFEN